ncbi:MAG: FliM/FliN family flagellar motor switch protein [Terracidiphilus sp.]|jgi:flagellar motor switch protein FliM
MIASSGSNQAIKASTDPSQDQRPRTIHSCNFRYAGRLSNENARTLTALHEKFALNVTTSLELYLGAILHLKLQSLEQMAIVDYVGRMAANSYLIPCALNVLDCNVLIEMDLALIFPIIDLLLGGAGTACENTREMTEIDEEIMQSVTSLIVGQIERAWHTLNLSLTAGRPIKQSQIQQVFMANERLVLLMFEMSVGETTAPFRIVLPTSFVGFLLRHLNAIQSKKTSSLRQLRSPSLRERILDCDINVSADITQMRVLVKDLVGLKPGAILKMKAPVKRPGRLTVDDVEIFEALLVRNGTRKAAQLSARSQEPAAAKE